MPQIQVLPQVRTFGNKLAEALGGAFKAAGEGIEKKRNRSRLEGILKQFQTEPQDTGVSTGDANQPNAEINNENQPATGTPKKASKTPSFIDSTQAYEAALPILGKEGAQILASGLEKRYELAEKEKAKIKEEQRAEAKNIREKNLDRQIKTITKIQEGNVGKREILRKQGEDLNNALVAVQSGNVGGADINWFANLLGPAGEPLKNMHGVQLESAMKDLTIDSLQRVSGQKNMWLDQMVKSALPGIGKKEESNEMLIKARMATRDVDEAVLDAQDRLIADYEAKGVSPPSNLEKLANDIVQPYAQLRMAQAAYDTRELYERSKGDAFLNNLENVPKGTPLTLQKRDVLMKKFNNDKDKVISKALNLGYTIPSRNVVERNEEQ